MGIITLISMLSNDAQELPRQQEAAVGEMRRQARILLVEDEEPVRSLLERVFSRAWYLVDAVADGLAALQFIARQQYDLIVCDLYMDGMGGQELYQHLAQYYPDLARRVIFMTGDTLSPQNEAFLRQSGCIYLGKPFALNDLLELARQVIAAGDSSPG